MRGLCVEALWADWRFPPPGLSGHRDDRNYFTGYYSSLSALQTGKAFGEGSAQPSGTTGETGWAGPGQPGRGSAPAAQPALASGADSLAERRGEPSPVGC